MASFLLDISALESHNLEWHTWIPRVYKDLYLFSIQNSVMIVCIDLTTHPEACWYNVTIKKKQRRSLVDGSNKSSFELYDVRSGSAKCHGLIRSCCLCASPKCCNLGRPPTAGLPKDFTIHSLSTAHWEPAIILGSRVMYTGGQSVTTSRRNVTSSQMGAYVISVVPEPTAVTFMMPSPPWNFCLCG